MPKTTIATSEFLEREYDTKRTAPDREEVLQYRLRLCEEARATLPAHRDIAYGASLGQRLDLYPAQGLSQGVLMFIHGGYWQALDKSTLAFLALALTRSGVTLALIDFDLAPAVTIDEMVDQARAATAWLWHNVDKYGGDRHRLHVGGMSAGAHLAAMVAATEWSGTDHSVPQTPVGACIAISGIYDLQPIRFTHINEPLGLDAAAAARNSPIHHRPTLCGPLLAVVGARESSEFHRQTNDLVAAWRPVAKVPFVARDRHHASILLDLVDPASALYAAVLDALGVAPGAAPITCSYRM